jgi:hypothetical protein
MRIIGASYPASFRNRDISVLRHNDMVEDRDATQLPHIPEPLGEIQIFSRRVGVTGRVVVAEDDRRNPLLDQDAEDVSWMHLDAGQTATRQTRLEAHAVSNVQAQGPEFLYRLVAQARPQVSPNIGRLAQALAETRPVSGRPPSQFEGRPNRTGAGMTHPFEPGKRRTGRTADSVNPAVRFKQISRHIEHVLVAISGPEQDRDQLGIGKAFRSIGHHAFARSFATREGFQI